MSGFAFPVSYQSNPGVCSVVRSTGRLPSIGATLISLSWTWKPVVTLLTKLS